MGEEPTLAETSLDNQIDLGCWRVSEEWVGEYLEAVGDSLPIYLQLGLAPPLALAARALGALLERLDLPAGAIHSLQEIQTRKAVGFGEEIGGVAHLRPARRRGDLQFVTAEFTLRNEAGDEVQTGKSTVLVTEGVSP